MERQPKPVEILATIGRFCLKIVNLYWPKESMGGYVPGIEPEIEPMARELWKHRYEQPPLWRGLPYYHEDRDNHLRPDGTRAVYNTEDFKRHLDEINGITDGLEARDGEET